MSDQTLDPRLEALLRDALNAEAASLPLRVTPDQVVERAKVRGSIRLNPRRPLSRLSMAVPAMAAAVAIVVAGVLGLNFVMNQQRIGVASPSPSATAASPEPTSASPEPTSGPPTSGGMWPQTNLEELQAAQDIADGGDNRYSWQLIWDGLEVEQSHPGDAKIFPRFLEEVLGWEQYLDGHHVPRQDDVDINDGDYVFIRCAPGETNPLYPADPEGAACAPTLDEFRYETVKVTVAQLARKGSSGLWVVTGWELIGPAAQVDPALARAEAESRLREFLQARLDGEGAERFVEQVPLLYATTTGEPYERFEIELVDGPIWPQGHTWFDVRLFTKNDQTVVEQPFFVNRVETRPSVIFYGPDQVTTENGNPVPGSYSFLDGELTLLALEAHSDAYRDIVIGDYDREILLGLTDPTPFAADCTELPAPTDPEALARIIGSDPRFEASAPVDVTIGGIPALQMDVVLAPGADYCSWSEGDFSESGPFLKYVPWQVAMGNPRARLHLLDLPEGPSARVLALVTIADEDSFEGAVEAAAPVLDSIEFHTP